MGNSSRRIASLLSKALVTVMIVGVVPLGLESTEQRSTVQEVPRIGYVGLRPINETAASMASICAALISSARGWPVVPAVPAAW
jgi:hypothetical protein